LPPRPSVGALAFNGKKWAGPEFCLHAIAIVRDMAPLAFAFVGGCRV
jgi:hypothetical protein